MFEFSTYDLKIHVYPSLQADKPVIYLHGLDGYGLDVLPLLKEKEKDDFSLVVISVPYVKWSSYLAPWATYAYDWCKWPVNGGSSCGKMAVGSYLEDPHNFIQILDTHIESQDGSGYGMEFVNALQDVLDKHIGNRL